MRTTSISTSSPTNPHAMRTTSISISTASSTTPTP
jgi:hypothetical protein